MFLAPIPGPDSAGLDLRNDMRFMALERALDGASRAVREDQVRKGNTGDVALDWARLMAEAESLAEAGRDLRLLVIVARLMTNMRGPAGLAEGLDLLADAVENWWESLHPALRDGDNPRASALRRINALHQIENADAGILGDLAYNSLLTPRGLAVVTGADLEAASITQGMLEAEGATGLSAAEQANRAADHEVRVNRVMTSCRACRDQAAEEVAAVEEGLGNAIAALQRLETALAARVGSDPPVRFLELGKVLGRMQATLAAPGGRPAVVATEALPDGAEGGGAVPAGLPIAPAAGLPARLTSRAEVEACLDLIIEFYQRSEPASPLPDLARRMRRMVPMTFLQLIEEIAPGGVKEFRSIAGVSSE
ncbi:MAG TPA: type VI secretion system ImpA family N-terminal domain-containing protein [Paracoccus sp. (in: a-proteobacteria)]|uniref:type VI secretion system protein TssA n=1 Tax=Paracoccus sp. TaxID=267 RepID=UPI002B9B9F46|nr:type VI secretion system ImpA family N-terminal domain-containing protein [Paracoccus sp. (in: a-proteobacteria)]HWL56736.1 type VI secretion system ImpA family N-terminal domain-containing protein [Paracoccus sp. (in: a-proteobacteria)]